MGLKEQILCKKLRTLVAGSAPRALAEIPALGTRGQNGATAKENV